MIVHSITLVTIHTKISHSVLHYFVYGSSWVILLSIGKILHTTVIVNIDFFI
jgi:hypothetical protein